ncbi:hypothetical protein BDN70DRAFT_896812 [Pholiota conissans]|uniref:Uncharacterized protein n=1 Tax=Pholiota conissans TaxID=109636 RepID=A0A9P5YXW4_9AGAR|nr:hypothetical protein BDN70DRAFT_896812 [Pholiota conissans]
MSKASTDVRQLQFAIRILIESGFLYLAVAIAHFVAWFTTSTYAIAFISSINISVTGVLSNLILIRTATHHVKEMSRIDQDADAISNLHFHIAAMKYLGNPHGLETYIGVELQLRRNDEEQGTTTLDLNGDKGCGYRQQAE